MPPRRLVVALLVLVPSTLVLADIIGPPLGPVDRTLVDEQPCDPTAAVPDTRNPAGEYMCQIGLDGKFFQPYPCEMIPSSSTSVYLRMAKWNVPCEITATVAKKSLRFSGSMMCEPTEPDVIGDDADVAGTLVAIAGGFRFERKVVKVVERGIGPPDRIPRPTRQRVTRPTLTLNVCRRAWPTGFVSDNVRAEQLERQRRR